MANIKISELPVATSVTTADIVVLNQGGDTKTASVSLVRGAGSGGTVTSVTAGTGLNGGTITSSGTIDVKYGTTSGTAAQGNDSRLSNSRTPTAHASTHATGGSDQLTSVALSTGTISGIPSATTDIVNKAYADSIGSSINFHDACDYATIAPLSPSANYNQPGGAGVGVNATLTGSTNVALQVDGTTVSVGQRILVKSQASQFQNGVYTVTQQGDGSTQPYILTRATDYDTSGSAPNEVQAGDFILILNGSVANTAWVQQTPAPIVFGSSNIVFIQFAAASTAYFAGTGLSLSSNTFSITTTGVSALTAGSASVIPVITTNTQGQITNLTTAQVTAAGIGAVATADLTQLAVAGKVPQLDGSGLISTTQIPALTSAQIAQITPAVIGAVATSDLTQLATAGKVPQLDGSGFLSTAQLADIAGLPVGAVGSSTVVPVITTDSKGRITNLATAQITGGGGSAGVASFSAGTTGFAPNTATTGDVTLTGTLNIANGGTGATSQAAALTSLGAAPLADVMHRYVDYTSFAIVTGTMNTGVTPNTFTITATGTYSPDGTVISVGDTVLFTAQTGFTIQNGPWVCTTAGAVGVQAVFQRPSWFSGTARNGIYCTVKAGITRNGYTFGFVGPAGSEINVGTSTVTVVTINQRVSNVGSAANTFSGKQTLAANTATVHPISFQTSTTQLSSLVANALEYVNDALYLTNNAATARAQIPTLATANTWSAAQTFNGQVNLSGATARFTVPLSNSAGSVPSIDFPANSVIATRPLKENYLDFSASTNELYFARFVTVVGNCTAGSGVVTLTGTSTTDDLIAGSSWSLGGALSTNRLITSIDSATQFTMDNPAAATSTGTSFVFFVREPIALKGTLSYGAVIRNKTASYTLAFADANATIAFNAATPVTLTIPTTATAKFLGGTKINIIQLSTALNQVTVAAASGVTLYSVLNKFKTNTQYSVITLTKISFNEWVMSGDTAV